jgi:hypothetical protein
VVADAATAISDLNKALFSVLNDFFMVTNTTIILNEIYRRLRSDPFVFGLLLLVF